MKKHKQLKKIKQSGLQRRLSISVAGAQSGVRLLGSHLGSVLLSEGKKRVIREESLAKESQLFVQQLGELKGAYVKIGQMMALYGDHLFPKQVTNALHSLEHYTNSMQWCSIEPLINTELKDKALELSIDPKPIAAASLAQVHSAESTHLQKQLVVKVQYPGVAKTIDADFNAVLQMLRLARWVKSGQDLERWTKEIKAILKDEVDYQRERKMTERVRRLLVNDERYLVPKTYERYSSKKILTMDFLKGYEVNHPKVARLSLKRRNDLAKAMLDVFFKEVFEWGIMQTDPNFGNYRIKIANKEESQDKLILLDFGAVRELEATFVKGLRKTILGAYQNDRAAVLDGAMLLNCLHESQKARVHESFIDFCILLMEPFRAHKTEVPNFALNRRKQYKWHDSRLLKRVGKLGAKSMGLEGFSPPPREFALIARKLTGVFTFVTTLKAEFNAHPILDQYVETQG